MSLSQLMVDVRVHAIIGHLCNGYSFHIHCNYSAYTIEHYNQQFRLNNQSILFCSSYIKMPLPPNPLPKIIQIRQLPHREILPYQKGAFSLPLAMQFRVDFGLVLFPFLRCNTDTSYQHPFLLIIITPSSSSYKIDFSLRVESVSVYFYAPEIFVNYYL